MVTIFWFRRDLRLNDNAALYHALKSDFPVQPVFIFDNYILDKLTDKEDARVSFIHEILGQIKSELIALNSDIKIYHGNPEDVFTAILSEFEVKAVFTNHDYEPYAIDRDLKIKLILSKENISLVTFKDQVIFEKDEVVKDDGLPYTIFTPYSKKWKSKLLSKLGSSGSESFYLESYNNYQYFYNFNNSQGYEMPSLSDLGFIQSPIIASDGKVKQGTIKDYERDRNFPSIKGTSHLGIHFRFGTVSIREKVRNAQKLSEIFLNELIWREFYMQILWHFPHVTISSFRKEYDLIVWRNDEKDFLAWCNGETGYPIVDAGMRELNATGFMHNRVRMITASFLTKHLLIDWRWGEAYFAQKLLDFELSSNNGGWQWAAGCGTDASPYFRIFSPKAQTEKFDKKLSYINKWVPEWNTNEYPVPIVDHDFARKRCLEVYKAALQK